MPTDRNNTNIAIPVRSIQRALEIVRVINESHFPTLHLIHQRTGLAKSTIHRLLATLHQEGIVRVDPYLPGQYRLTSAAKQLSSSARRDNYLNNVFNAPITDLTHSIYWPISVALIKDEKLLTIACSMPAAKYSDSPSMFGSEHSFLTSEIGKTYLAFATPAERKRIYLRDMVAEGEGAMAYKDFAKELRAVRSYGGYLSVRRLNQMDLLCLPLFIHQTLHGCIYTMLPYGILTKKREALLFKNLKSLSARFQAEHDRFNAGPI